MCDLPRIQRSLSGLVVSEEGRVQRRSLVRALCPVFSPLRAITFEAEDVAVRHGCLNRQTSSRVGVTAKVIRQTFAASVSKVRLKPDTTYYLTVSSSSSERLAG